MEVNASWLPATVHRSSAGEIFCCPAMELLVSRCLRAVAALAVGLLVAAPASAQQTSLKVVVTSKPIHAIVAAVMKGVGEPALLIDGPASPHTYAMRPSDATLVNRADVLFRVSEALEPFTAKVVRSLPKTVKVVTLAEAPQISLLARRTGGPFEARSHVHAHGHKHGNAKPADGSFDAHVWLDPDNAKAMAAMVVASLAEKLPAEVSKLQANGKALDARLDALASSLSVALRPIADKPFVVLHDAYQYFERRFGLTAVGSILVDPDEMPSAKRLTDLRQKVSKLAAVCVFAEPNYQPRAIESVTEGTSARTATLDPEGTMLKPGPDLYFELMERMTGAMKGCLAPQS